MSVHEIKGYEVIPLDVLVRNWNTEIKNKEEAIRIIRAEITQMGLCRDSLVKHLKEIPEVQPDTETTSDSIE